MIQINPIWLILLSKAAIALLTPSHFNPLFPNMWDRRADPVHRHREILLSFQMDERRDIFPERRLNDRRDTCSTA
ncbi:MAG: hypothetical protein GY792_13885 [Gammaproteobacteria bacterium]|nr:hypothetical protein [Gammaproteobacteria bacterium]